MSTLAERVERRMADLGLKQAEVARRSKVKAPSVQQWRNGHTKTLAGDVLLRAAQALQCRPAWLATGVGPMENNPYAPDAHTAEEPQPSAQIVSASGKRQPKWPFAHIDPMKVGALSSDDAQQLEGAWRVVAKQLNIDIEVETEPHAVIARPGKRSSR